MSCAGKNFVFFPGGPEGGPFASIVYAGAKAAADQTGCKVDYVWSDWNPQKMVQIAMAVKDVAYEDIVFVQYPTVYAEGGLRVQPVLSDAAVLFDALANNQPLQLTGSTSDGYGTEVVGEATKPDAGATATPAPTETAAPDAGTGATEAPAPTETSVALPSTVTGQNAAQVTCTVAQR